MPVGQIWPSEAKELEDPQTHVRMRQLTDYKAHSHHLYFTNPGWYDDNRRLVVSSDRGNRTNLYGIELASGEMTQLTDLEPLEPPYELEFVCTCTNPVKPEAYYWYGRKLMAVDMTSLKSRQIYEMPEGFVRCMMNCTCDGRFVCAGIYEDLSDRIHMDTLRGYVGFRECSEAKPLSRIEVIPVDGGDSRTLWQEKYWISHVNTSPTLPDTITFCHEGPWAIVDHRIWGLNINSGDPWKICPCEEGKNIGHEYWYADGETLGYHGRYGDHDGQQFIGRIRYDNTEPFEVEFPGQTGHTHSNDHRMIVGDGGSVVRLWQFNGTTYDGPRILCTHRCSKQTQQLHVHPRFTPDGKGVLFTSDMSGYGNIYVADVPDFDSLPAVDAS